jgi:hypothetical protein
MTSKYALSIKLAALAIWLAAVAFGVLHHVMWRDEVRNYTLALQGDTVIDMVRGVKGESAPLVWYLLLRGVHFLVGANFALPLAAFVVAGAAALILVFQSPFSWPVVALILFSRFFVFEYSVMARNYGIAMLILFAIAAVYSRRRDSSSIVLGLLLFLLANCSVHAAILSAAFLVFWLLDLLAEDGLRWTPATRNFAVNAAIATAGAFICFITIYPTVNDADVRDLPEAGRLLLVSRAVFDPATTFHDLFSPEWLDGRSVVWSLLASAVLFGAVLGLLPRLSAVVAGALALVMFSLFFTLVYYGSYRHETQWLAFLISLYWIKFASGAPDPNPSRFRKGLAMTGYCLFLALLVIQVTKDGNLYRYAGVPNSRALDFANFVSSKPELRDAVVLASPDHNVETLHYYMDNPTYLVREHRYGKTRVITKKAILDLHLDDILAAAHDVHRQSGKPVIILLQWRLDPNADVRVYREGYALFLTATKREVQRFLDSTTLVRSFPPALTDESYDAYVLKASP